jgi:thiol-disulfide isomerase/thioredoxin
MSPGRAARRLSLLTRPECGLCEAMLAELQQYAAAHPIPDVELVDVDSDQVLQRRFGLKIPVLLLSGAVVCQQRFDPDELTRLLRL